MTNGDPPILVVDDDPDIQEALVDTLGDRGFRAVTADNGLAALAILRGTPVPPSVILLDLMMPVMDGYAFLEEREKDPALAAIPVAIITAAHGVDRRRLGAGVRVMSKPIQVSELFNVIHDLQSLSRR